MESSKKEKGDPSKMLPKLLIHVKKKKIIFSLAKVIWFGFPHDPNSADNYQFSVSLHAISVWPLNSECTHSPRD